MKRRDGRLKNILIISATILAIAIIIFLIVNNLGPKVTLATVPFNSQCSLPSCPSGYSQTDIHCSDSSNKCYRDCEMDIPDYCGTYGSFSVVESRSILGLKGASNRGSSYNTDFYGVSSSYCYKFYSQTTFSVSSWGSADSYSVYSANSWYSKTECSTSSSKTVTTSTYTLGRGSSGSSYSSAGKFYDYGGSSCSGGVPLLDDLDGSLNIYLYMSRAPWTDGGVDTETTSCAYQCDIANDCGTNGLIGSRYCKDNSVYQLYKTYSCSSYTCGSSDADRLIENCLYGCSSGSCISVECTSGDEKCSGTTHFTCSANKWVEEGEITGKCGVSCVDRDIIQSNSTYYICTQGSYKPILDVIELSLEEQERIANLINGLNVTIEQKEKIINELTSTLEGQISLINNLNASIQDKARIITDLQTNLNNQVIMIDSLNANLIQKAQIIDSLNLSIQQQAFIIQQLTETSDEQVILIQNLNLNIQQQAEMINTLTSNLEEKARLVSLLQAENEEQAQLIEEMRLSFGDQAIIIESLHKTIEDDADIIQNMNLSLSEQAEIISNLHLTNTEQATLINNLNLKVSEQAVLITKLNNTLEDDAEIIRNLNLELIEEAQLVEELNLTVEEDIALIAQLRLSVEQEKVLVAQLQLKVEEQLKMLQDIQNEKERIEQEMTKVIIIFTIIGIIFISILTFLIVKLRKARRNR